MILHTVNRSPFGHDTLRDCLRFAAAGDAILLIEDGVYGALRDSPALASLTLPDGIAIYALRADVAARGLRDLVASSVTEIDYAGFVELTEQHERVMSWF